MGPLKKAAAVLAAGTLVFGLFTAAPAQAHSGGLGDIVSLKIHESHEGWCLGFKLPVAPAEGQPRSWKVALTYCEPFRWARGQHQVDVLTHGSTYTNEYWDWPQQPELYSYVGKTLDADLGAGRATLDYDRIGNGASTRPASSTEITMATDAFMLHQLIVALHSVGYRRINSVSHSYGSGVALAEAATDYGDHIKVDKLVLSGYLHRPSNPAVTAGNYPANLDPKFAAAGLDGGWLTTRPGARLTGFHSPTSDPAVVARDEEQKDIVSRTGLLDFLGQRGVPAATNVSNKITVPVLVVEGQLDAIFCYDPATFNCADGAGLTANETPFYGAAASFQVVAVPLSGHDLTLHPSANASFAVINDFLK